MPGTVPLDRVDLVRRQPRVRERLADHALLGETVGRGKAVARAVLVDRAAAHHREHRVTQRSRVGEPLEHQQAHALRDARAVRGVRERLAAPVRREPPLAAEAHERQRRAEHRHPARERQRALPRAQRPTRQVQRHQRGRAGRVDRHRRPLQPQRVRHPAREHARRGARQQVALRAVERRQRARRRSPARSSPRTPPVWLPRSELGCDSRAFERLPRGFEQQPLLGIHRRRLAGADPKEVRVEVRDPVHEPALAHVASARVVGVGVVERVEIPVAIGRERRDRVDTAREQPPQLLRRAHSARIPAAHPYDRDRLARAARRAPPAAAERRPAASRDLLQQVDRERLRVGVVEDQRRGQAQPRRRLQPVAQLDREQRVEPELFERPPRVDRLGRVVAQHRGHLAPHQLEPRRAGAPRRGRPPDALRQRSRAPAARRAGVRTRPRSSAGSAPARGLRAQRRGVQAHGDRQRLARRAAPRRTARGPPRRRTARSPRASPAARSASLSAARQLAGRRPPAPRHRGAGSPCARRWAASPSRKTFAAA